MFVIFLFAPLVAFLYSLRDLSKKKFAAIFILFYGLFGYCQHFELETSDIYRRGCWFESTDLAGNVFMMYSNGEIPDLYTALTGLLIRSVTDNPKIYIGILGLVFGILCYNFYKYIYQNWTRPKHGIFFLLIFLALTNISLTTFTGIRNATASMLFLCSAYRYIYCDKKLWIAGVLLSTLIHFQIWSVVAVFMIYILTPLFVSQRAVLFKVLLILAFILSLTNLSGRVNRFIEDNSDMVSNASIVNKADVYTNGEEEELEDGNTLYRQANQLFFKSFSVINRFGILVIMWLLINYMQKHRLDKPERRLYMFLLLLSVTVIAFYSINYHLGSRISNIWWELLYVFLARLFCLDGKIAAKKWLFFILFVNFAYIAQTFINAPRLVEPSFWLYPAPLSIYTGLGFSIPNNPYI